MSSIGNNIKRSDKLAIQVEVEKDFSDPHMSDSWKGITKQKRENLNVLSKKEEILKEKCLAQIFPSIYATFLSLFCQNIYFVIYTHSFCKHSVFFRSASVCLNCQTFQLFFTLTLCLSNVHVYKFPCKVFKSFFDCNNHYLAFRIVQLRFLQCFDEENFVQLCQFKNNVNVLNLWCLKCACREGFKFSSPSIMLKIFDFSNYICL